MDNVEFNKCLEAIRHNTEEFQGTSNVAHLEANALVWRKLTVAGRANEASDIFAEEALEEMILG